MKYTIILILAVLLATLAGAAKPKWHQLESYTFERYQKDFSKKYASVEEQAQREKLFSQKLSEVKAFNAGKHSYKKGINHMSDWTLEEFKYTLGGKSVEMAPLVEEHRKMGLVHEHKTVKGSDLPLPKSVDWRNANPSVLTAVKNQGNCGSCWAHGATEQMETYWALATNELFTLSTQETTACTPNPNQCGGTGGCDGATAELGYTTAIGQSLTEEWQYPYTAFWGTTGTCKVPEKSTKDITVTGYSKVLSNDQGTVMNALAYTGPLAVNVEADTWQDYESGVFAGCNYAKNITIDHVVQAVGYGTDEDSGLDYFIIRNSWSPAWGEHGFIRLLRTSTPNCGWCVKPQDGTGCKGGPTQLWTCGECGILYDTSYPIVRSD